MKTPLDLASTFFSGLLLSEEKIKITKEQPFNKTCSRNGLQRDDLLVSFFSSFFDESGPVLDGTESELLFLASWFLDESLSFSDFFSSFL